MQSVSTKQNIEDYIRVVSGSGEAGLLVAPPKVSDILVKYGFQEVNNPSQLAKSSFVRIDEINQKFWYDVASQYPHGQIQWTDAETKEVQSLKLNPFVSSLILLCDEVSLSRSPDLRTVSGVAFHFK